MIRFATPRPTPLSPRGERRAAGLLASLGRTGRARRAGADNRLRWPGTAGPRA